jgi:hypothetical protein
MGKLVIGRYERLDKPYRNGWEQTCSASYYELGTTDILIQLIYLLYNMSKIYLVRVLITLLRMFPTRPMPMLLFRLFQFLFLDPSFRFCFLIRIVRSL